MNTGINIDDLRNSKIPLVIWGAGILGKVVYNFCQSVGIVVDIFCDNNINKTHSKYCNTAVVHAPEISKTHKDAIFIISASDIVDVVEQLAELGYKKYIPCAHLLKNFDYANYENDVPLYFVEYVLGTATICHNNYIYPQKLFTKSIDIIITEKCSLKCRDCANLMQYYKNPVDCDIDELIASIDKACSCFDEINEFRVIGGEPFMNKKWFFVVDHLNRQKNINKVLIYTNGTIIPDKNHFQSLMNDKIIIYMTDYGLLSKNTEAFKNKLMENGIPCYVNPVGRWTSCSKIQKHNRSDNESKKIFDGCCAKNLITLSDGKLFRCPFIANVFRLGATLNAVTDHVNLFENNISLFDMKNKIREFILSRKVFYACDYCDGRSLSAPTIEPAIQIDKPIKYKKLV